jgi:hypothetical protein
MANIWIKSSRKNIGACAAHMFTSVPTVSYVCAQCLAAANPSCILHNTIYVSKLRDTTHGLIYSQGARLSPIQIVYDTPVHKVLTYIENRAVSGVFRTMDPPPPLHPASVSFPLTKGGGSTHSPGSEGVGGQYFGRRQP